ncbi:MAG: hypothetical protein OSA84_08270 [Akkermansiaceae bacterium]|nr:hypothetical protein [Akkermansiaceae bacterium]
MEKDKSLIGLSEGYLGALARIMTKYQRAGHLDEVLLVKDEMKDISNGKWPLLALPKKISLEVAEPRKLYLKKRIEIDQNAARQTAKTADKMLALLEKQSVNLTKAGDLQQALLARQIKADIESNPTLASSRKLLVNVMTDGRSKPALRIRRYGDNIEMIVRYDMRGKVSMDSPVSNVEEKDKTVGDTTATVLGEFIGTEGYNVTPLRLINKTFDGKDPSPIALARIIPTFQSNISENTGVGLSIDPKEEGNWYIRIPRVNPPASAPGTIRISCRYFVPKDNKEIVGFLLSGTELNQRGKWATGETITQSQPDSEEPSNGIIYFLFGAESGEKINLAKASLEKVYLHSIKAEQIKFSAFVVQRLGANGVITETFEDPAKQPRFATNGELLAN